MKSISAFMTSVRPERWLAIHTMLVKSGVDFELVVVSPRQPDFPLPQNIRIHYSDLKPSQCLHAAAKLCRNDALLQIVDDVVYSDGAIRLMYETLQSGDNITVTCRYFFYGRDYSECMNIAGEPSDYLPLLPVCGMFSRSAYESLGGIDRRFSGVMGELDLYMRMYMSGYKTVFIDGTVTEDKTIQETSGVSLSGKYWKIDRPKFVSLWTTGGALYLIRNDIFRGYDDSSLLIREQN